MPTVSPFWDRDVHRDRAPFLHARAKIVRALRRWFEDEGFTEVETAALQVSPGNEAHLSGFATTLHDGEGGTRALYLHTSPEFACKKLLAAGERRIVTFAKVFRNGERGPLHSPEFTMLEWYRADAPLTALMDDCTALMRVAAEAALGEAGIHPFGNGRGADAVAAAPDRDAAPQRSSYRPWTWRDRSCDPFASPEQLTVAAAFTRFAGIDLLASLADSDNPDRDALAGDVAALGIRVAHDDTWSDLFSKVLSDRIEPQLAQGDRATILYDYPLPEAALARPHPRDPRVAERFELYACGVELANAFGELTDPIVQRQRFEAAGALRRARYGDAPPPIDEDFLAALAQMPEASGIALGLDRLVMLAVGASRIDQVIWTPVA